MKLKPFFLITIFVLSAIIINIFFTSCSTYLVTTSKTIPVTASYQDIIFENKYWEQTKDSSLLTIELPGRGDDLQPDAVKSLTIFKRGASITVCYLNSCRDNRYKFEIVNGRIILYWQAENQSEVFEPVTVIVRLEQ